MFFRSFGFVFLDWFDPNCITESLLLCTVSAVRSIISHTCECLLLIVISSLSSTNLLLHITYFTLLFQNKEFRKSTKIIFDLDDYNKKKEA